MRKKLLAIIAVAAMVVAMIPATVLAGETVYGPDASEYPVGTAVCYGENYYATLAEALDAVYKSEPTATAEIYCKAGADVGTMTHGHVADDIIIYGNGAKVSGGERDIEIDTYQFDRSTGSQSATGKYIEKNIAIKVIGLNGIAAWGQRQTTYTVDLSFENCQNMQRVYLTGATGTTNISIKNCSFDGSSDALKSNTNTSIYSNAAGNITIENTTFKEISVPINMNNKSSGLQTITVKNCKFEDCALSGLEAAYSTKTYSAPVRIVAQSGATTNLIINDCDFNYSEGKGNSANGDILIGEGRSDKTSGGIMTLKMTGTKANVTVQTPGYYDANGVIADATKATTTAVEESNVVEPNTDSHFVVKEGSGKEDLPNPDGTQTPVTPDSTKPATGKTDATAATGDDMNMALPITVAGLALAAMAAVIATRRRHS